MRVSRRTKPLPSPGESWKRPAGGCASCAAAETAKGRRGDGHQNDEGADRQRNLPATVAASSTSLAQMAGRSAPRCRLSCWQVRGSGSDFAENALLSRRAAMTTIYKICPAELWRKAEAEGVFRGAGVDLADGFIHFSTAETVKETAARHFAGVADLVLVAFDDLSLGPELRYEPSRGGAALSPSLRPARSRRRRSGSGHCRWPKTDGTSSRTLRHEPRLPADAALRLRHRPGDGAPAGGARRGGGRAGAAQDIDRSAPGCARAGARLSEPGRPCRRLRQERRGDRRDACRRLRLHRGRHADAAAAGRQSAPACLPPAGGLRGHQPHGLQQSRASTRPSAG